MFNSLKALKEQLCSVTDAGKVSQDQIKAFKENCTVVLMAGGEGSRFGKYAELQDKHKTLLSVNRETLIERIIKMYRDAGIKDFVALVFHQADSIKNILKDGAELGVRVRYSHDPGKPVGKGGAILNALQQGILSKDKHIIVHNPDDQVVLPNFADHVITQHLAGKGLGTVVVVEGTDYAFTGMKITESKVSQIEMYPFIPIPTHIGVTVFSKEALPYFEKLFDLEQKADFEKVLFPLFARDNQLAAAVIPKGSWYSINNPKELKKFIAALN